MTGDLSNWGRGVGVLRGDREATLEGIVLCIMGGKYSSWSIFLLFTSLNPSATMGDCSQITFVNGKCRGRLYIVFRNSL